MVNTTDNPHSYIKVMLAHNFIDRTNLRLDFVVVVVPSNEVKSDRKIMITTSIGSPRCIRVGTASGVFPIEGPQLVTRVFPVVRSNSRASAR